MTGVTGDGAPRRRSAKAELAPTTPDPIEIAMEAVANAAGADSPAYRLLVKQERLVERQTALTGWQIASERAGLVLKILTGVAAAAAAVVLTVMVWQAKNANGLLVEPFSVPPDLRAQGLTGEVVALRMLDRLATMQAETDSMRRPDSYANAWGEELNLAIPTTGLNLGELQSALRRWLGHETRIRGEISRGPSGMVLSGRVAGRPGFAVQGAEADIPALIDQAALEILHQTQSYRYASWLLQHRREEEAIEAYLQLARTGPNDRERAWGYRGYALQMIYIGDPEAGLEAARRAVRLRPSMAQGWWTLSSAELALGRGEAALVARKQGIKVAARDPDINAWGKDSSVHQAWIAEWLGDYRTALNLYRREREPANAVNAWPAAPLGEASVLGKLHELAAARRAVEALAAEFEERAAEGGAVRVTSNERSLVRARWTLAEAAEDWTTIVAGAEQAEARAIFGVTSGAKVRSALWHQLVRARAETGNLAGAAVMLQEAPADCDRCLLSRARVAALSGDWRSADAWFTRAVAAAPSFPQPHHEWGQQLLRKGDVAGALNHAKAAARISPRFADAHLLWGEALLAAGDPEGAVAEIATAAKLTPRWGRLHLKWGEALAKLGQTDEARAKWREAAGMDLSAVDRARVQELLKQQPS